MIDSNVITVKKTKQGQDLFLTKDATAIPTEDNTVSISLNYRSQDATSLNPNDIDLSVTSTQPKDSRNTKLNLTSNHNFVSLELFNMTRLNITIMLRISYKISVTTKD